MTGSPAGVGTSPPRLGITIPFDLPLAELPPVLDGLRQAGYGEFWTAETARLDALSPLAFTAAVAPGATVGSAIASVFSRGPALLAMSAAAVAEAAPGRFVLGVGASSPTLTEDWNATRFDRPLTRVRDMVRFLRAALAGERVDAQFETFAVRRFQLERPPAVPPPVLIAALRPAMLRLGATEADGVVLNWLSPDDVRTAREHAARPARVAARIFVCVSDDTTLVRDRARRLIATYATVPAYAEFHRWLGRGADLAPMWDASSSGDRKGAAAAVPDTVVDDLIVHGDPDRCAELVRRYCAAGVDHPIIKLLPLDPSRDLIADAVELGAAFAAPHVDARG
jgi:probable F420-dependent oxidoreductase